MAIVMTAGPATSDPIVLQKVLPLVDIVRFNMSHGSHDEHRARYELVKSVRPDVKVLFDLQGPKIRISYCPEPLQFAGGDLVRLTYHPDKKQECTRDILYVSLPEITKDLNIGDKILFNDGYLSAVVVDKKDNNDIVIKMLHDGVLSSYKGLNSSTASLSVDPLTEKDLADMDFALTFSPEYIAVSFVRHADDLYRTKELIRQKGGCAQVIAKIERHEAITNIDAIIEATDVIMIARGDLGVEVELTDLPLLQEMMATKCLAAGKPCIWATQVLESMISAPRPTRAEVTDMYQAITLGSTHTMLSAESAVGKYPVEAIMFMHEMWTRYKK